MTYGTITTTDPNEAINHLAQGGASRDYIAAYVAEAVYTGYETLTTIPYVTSGTIRYQDGTWTVRLSPVTSAPFRN